MHFLRNVCQLIPDTAVGNILHMCPLLGFVATAAPLEVSSVSKICLQDCTFWLSLLRTGEAVEERAVHPPGLLVAAYTNGADV